MFAVSNVSEMWRGAGGGGGAGAKIRQYQALSDSFGKQKKKKKLVVSHSRNRNQREAKEGKRSLIRKRGFCQREVHNVFWSVVRRGQAGKSATTHTVTTMTTTANDCMLQQLQDLALLPLSLPFLLPLLLLYYCFCRFCCCRCYYYYYCCCCCIKTPGERPTLSQENFFSNLPLHTS